MNKLKYYYIHFNQVFIRAVHACMGLKMPILIALFRENRI